MADSISKEKRSYLMSRITAKDTKPEMMVRKALHSMGFRYLLHDKRLPGKPDLVFPKYSAVIEVQGCFWHGHDCHIYNLPKTNVDYWSKKINYNRSRDKEKIKKLRNDGWRVLFIWECALKGKTKLDFVDLIDKASSWLVGKEEFCSLHGSK